MASDMTGITFLTDKYFFLKTSSHIGYESKKQRIRKLEMQARKAIIKFSRDDLSLINDYLPEEKNEIITWINEAIKECSKGRKQQQKGKS